LKELILNIKHDVNIVLGFFSDPDFALPRVIPGYGNHARDENSFKVFGVLGMYPYVMEGSVIGTSIVRYVFKFIDGLEGNGFIEISRTKDGLKFTLDYDGDQKKIFESTFEKTIKKMRKTIDEEVRLERIKRKV